MYSTSTTILYKKKKPWEKLKKIYLQYPYLKKRVHWIKIHRFLKYTMCQNTKQDTAKLYFGVQLSNCEEKSQEIW